MSNDSDIQFQRFTDILKRRSRLVAMIALCGTIAVGTLAWYLPTRYTAKAQIVVEETRALSANTGGSARDSIPDPAAILTEVAALSSDELLSNVFDRLVVDPDFQALHARPKPLPRGSDGKTKSPTAWAPYWAGAVSIWERWVNEIELSRFLHTDDSRNVARAAPGGPTMDELRKRLKVYQELGSHVIAVTYTSANAAEAAAIVNKLVAYYVEEGDAQRRASLDRALVGLRAKITDVRKETQTLEASTAAYQAAHGLTDAAKSNVVDQKLGDLNRQLSEAQAELAARTTRRARVMALKGGAADWEPLLTRLDAGGLVDLHAQVMALLQSHRDSIVVPLPGRGPRGDLGETLQLRAKVRNVLDQALEKLAVEQEVAQSRETTIQQRLNAVQAASDDRNLRELVMTSESVRHRYDYLLHRRDELIEQRDSLSSTARLLSRASIPDRPSSPNPLLFIPPGAIASLVFGCMVALMRERLERTLHSENDIRAILGVSCGGLVPRLSRGANSRTLVSVQAKAYTEAIRSIMVGLQLSWIRHQTSKVILVTSSVPGEGKSTLALSLASYATRAGSRTLLLDLDVSDAAAATEDSRRQGGRMLDILTLDHIAIDIIRGKDGTEINYLPVRRGRAGDPVPLFSVHQIPELLRRLRINYDYIIIDSAPVLAVAEARLLVAFVDKVLLAVRWGVTSRTDARAAMGLLRQAGHPDMEISGLVSAVITQVNLKQHARRHHGDQGEALAKYGGSYISGPVPYDG